MALMSFLHAGWFGDLFDSTPTPRHTMAIDLSKAGNVAETDIRIDEKYSVYVELYYDYRKQKIGGDRYGEIIEKYFGRHKAFPIFPIKLTVLKYEKTGTSIVVDKIYYTNSLGRTYSSREINEFKLQEGAKYHIKVETVEDYPELAELNVEVAIGYYKTK
ncbi:MULTISPECIES: DUF5625 family protein [unclassified Sulfuricurvum]|uniref:DUF5625 family protein n=1 Tax=unclassified Sulfuricurvum TaxID=2632390 RepID=UPI0025C70DB4|nr:MULTISPECIES: DUF5625 family protein [unclassified Sulfuricurvum]